MTTGTTVATQILVMLIAIAFRVSTAINDVMRGWKGGTRA